MPAARLGAVITSTTARAAITTSPILLGCVSLSTATPRFLLPAFGTARTHRRFTRDGEIAEDEDVREAGNFIRQRSMGIKVAVERMRGFERGFQTPRSWRE